MNKQYGKYGEAAINVARKCIRSGFDPIAQWKSEMERLFPNSIEEQKKGCPRCAFLGLCKEGLVKGISPRDYTYSEKNKNYALKAVELLEIGRRYSSPIELWRAVTNSSGRGDYQMDVVLALWENNLIVRRESHL
jgi:hypothetical protein